MFTENDMPMLTMFEKFQVFFFACLILVTLVLSLADGLNKFIIAVFLLSFMVTLILHGAYSEVLEKENPMEGYDSLKPLLIKEVLARMPYGALYLGWKNIDTDNKDIAKLVKIVKVLTILQYTLFILLTLYSYTTTPIKPATPSPKSEVGFLPLTRWPKNTQACRLTTM